MAANQRPNRRFRDVRVVEESLRALVGELEPDGVFLTEATRLWTAFDAIERLAASAKTLLARRVDDARSWKAQGYRSAADQLASVAGTSVAAARNQLETSKRIEELSATADAMRAGTLSAAKAQVVADAAHIAPAAEVQLLELAARAPLAAVREECLRAKAAVDRDGAHERVHSDRRVREWTDAEGAWNLAARGTPEAGARFRAALEPVVDEIFKTARAKGRKEAREAYAFDALIQLAERKTHPDKRPSPRFLGLVRVDHEALRRGSVDGDEICEIAGLGPIPVTGAQRELLGEAILKLVVTNGVDVVNVTNLRRSATTAQRVALWWQSPMCRVQDCTRTQRLEIDHRSGWGKTRRTQLDDLDRLCEHHHDLKTYDGWALLEGEGARPMVAPDDPRHPRNRPPPDP